MKLETIKPKLPKRLPNGTRAWTSSHYDRVADVVCIELGIRGRYNWALIRLAIRTILETLGNLK